REGARRRDDRLILIDSINGGIVAGLDADQQFRREYARPSRLGNQLFQHGRGELAAAASTVREARERDRHFQSVLSSGVGRRLQCRSQSLCAVLHEDRLAWVTV